ncbi:hypothetical protein J4G33_06260 [Actinotalea sp. BY-33]|uniref:Uncharacterized protein n=1 Tax=Actinotalea soli TaxID=2819234 RepID=A0A939RV98_9CELL|nr:hypothetical protein [Actinotalea soli]MBO1751403.1 hypothetical protein [Actinotalea soli]
MSTRTSWLPTWVQPLAAALVILLGRAAYEDYPAGESGETVLLVFLGLTTLPGLVAAVVDAVRAARRTPPGTKPGYQRMLDTVAPRGETPVMPASVAADVATRVITWGLAQAGLSLALGLLLMPLPGDEGWRTLALFPAVGGVVAALVVLLGGILWLGVMVLVMATRSGGDEPLVDVPAAPEEMNQRRPVVFRAMLVALGTSLIGTATFGVPYIVLTWDDAVYLPRGVWSAVLLGEDAMQVEDAFVGWVWSLRVTVAMMLGGLAVVVVLSPVAFWWMVLRPRRAGSARDGTAPDGPAPD